jgi:nucleoside-diphosphate-sugar epimerase
MTLAHKLLDEENPSQTIILGAGFVGSAAARCLKSEGASCLSIRRKDLDLLSDGADEKLASLINNSSTLVIVSALAPVKNYKMLHENLRMLEPIVNVLSEVKPAHIVYVSSDAVYKDSSNPLSENSCAEPSSLHGVMHLTREIVLREIAGDIPLAIVRPSLIYGLADPHNGYGPNRFYRDACNAQDIQLFGEGEERRDHVYIDDVGELISRVVRRRSEGVLNIATGEVYSFREIAEKIAKRPNQNIKVVGNLRNGPIPHNGYRAFDAAATHLAFPDFKYTSIKQGLRLMFES